ncbi:ubiquitin-conjugating enzyme E2 2-like [Macadamia integrifolia]|uniref:ubiquitin-conjugating enzyme E2 2-like n=1 Tax=Macadamia integrifolia TaxID=60698 RepID=UPI001C4EE3AA|nr:ubiquitin-conjugating enzyme E2 2-like [Macadamia integrifolia]
MSLSQLRLMFDLKSIINEPLEGCSASSLSDDNLFVCSATIFGPDETPWEGGVFGLRLIFGDNCPEKPPRGRFTSEIFHPNGWYYFSFCCDIFGSIDFVGIGIAFIYNSSQLHLISTWAIKHLDPETSEC